MYNLLYLSQPTNFEMSDVFLAASNPYDAMAKYKAEKTPEEICADPRAHFLIPLLKEAYSIGYDEEP